MSVIETFFNTQITNIRKTTTGSTAPDIITTVTSFNGLIRPVADKAKLYNQNNVGREFDCATYIDTNINVGDTLIAESKEYSVLGKAIYTDLDDGTEGYLNIRLSTK